MVRYISVDIAVRTAYYHYYYFARRTDLKLGNNTIVRSRQKIFGFRNDQNPTADFCRAHFRIVIEYCNKNVIIFFCFAITLTGRRATACATIRITFFSDLGIKI